MHLFDMLRRFWCQEIPLIGHSVGDIVGYPVDWHVRIVIMPLCLHWSRYVFGLSVCV